MLTNYDLHKTSAPTVDTDDLTNAESRLQSLCDRITGSVNAIGLSQVRFDDDFAAYTNDNGDIEIDISLTLKKLVIGKTTRSIGAALTEAFTNLAEAAFRLSLPENKRVPEMGAVHAAGGYAEHVLQSAE